MTISNNSHKHFLRDGFLSWLPPLAFVCLFVCLFVCFGFVFWFCFCFIILIYFSLSLSNTIGVYLVYYTLYLMVLNTGIICLINASLHLLSLWINIHVFEFYIAWLYPVLAIPRYVKLFSIKANCIIIHLQRGLKIRLLLWIRI